MKDKTKVLFAVLFVIVPLLILGGWLVYATGFQGFPFDYGFYRSCAKLKEGMTKEEVTRILQKYIDDHDYTIYEEKPVFNMEKVKIYDERFVLKKEGFTDELICGGDFTDNILKNKILSFD